MIRDASAACKTLTGKDSCQRKDALMKVATKLTAAARARVLACSAGEKLEVLPQEEQQSNENSGKRKASSKPLLWVSKKKKSPLPICMSANA